MRAIAWGTLLFFVAIPLAIVGLFLWRKQAASARLAASPATSALGPAALPVQSPATTSSAGPSTARLTELPPPKTELTSAPVPQPPALSLKVLAPFIPTQDHPIDTTEPVSAVVLENRAIFASLPVFSAPTQFGNIIIPQNTINPYARANAARDGIFLDEQGKEIYRSPTQVYAPGTLDFVNMINAGTFTLANVKAVWQGPRALKSFQVDIPDASAAAGGLS